MPAAPRAFPYIGTTWLTKLLTGESSCEWAAWFKAHHQGYAVQPSRWNLGQWQIEHTALLGETRDKFLESGDTVHVEAQNAFRLQGRTAVLAGHPDLIIPSGYDVLIVHVKAGVERASHVAQVMAYMYALPPAMDRYKDARLSGEIHYPNRIQCAPRGGFDQGLIHQLITLIHRVAAPEPPPTTPNPNECGFCDVTVADDPERVDIDPSPNGGTTDDWCRLP